jgi:hypothetical protein
VDGFIAHTFSPQDTHNFFALLLRTREFVRQYQLSYSQGVWYIVQSPPYFHPPPPGVPIQNLRLPLDFSARTTQGTIVPQRRWTPADEIDVRRYVATAELQLPVYFVNKNGGVGFWLPDILQGRDQDLYNGNGEAPLGGKSTTHLRIHVSSHAFMLATRILIYALIHVLLCLRPQSGLAVTIGNDRFQLKMRLMHGTRSPGLDS